MLFDDEWDGVGGTYLVDPNTGKRRPITAEPIAEPQPEPQPATTLTPVTEQTDGPQE